MLNVLDEHPGNHKVTLKVRVRNDSALYLLLPAGATSQRVPTCVQVHVPHLDLDAAQTAYLGVLAGNVCVHS